MGGDKQLCEFSTSFEKAQFHLDSYKDEFHNGLLSNYYIVGYYDQKFRFVQNPDCFLFNEETKKQMIEDINYVNSQFDLFY